MLNLILFAIIVLLCAAILYAHRKHADVLDEIRAALARLHKKFDEKP